MDLFDRIFRAHRLFSAARLPISHRTLQEKLECSRATVTRIIGEMRDHLNAPIEYDRERNGYRYASQAGEAYELPGLWFNASELYALLVAQQLLSEAQPGLLEEHLAPLRSRIEQILKTRRTAKGDIAARIRILRMNSRRLEPEHFRAIAGALLEGRRLAFTYHARGKNEVTEREVSPQRMIHYRDNWYLDAFDHGKNALRSFSVDRIRALRVLGKKAREIPARTLNEYFTASYGIFAGKPAQRAVLRFSPERARWVADEVWHPQQVGRFEGAGYILEIPYSDPRELMLDILRYGADVEVLAPASLREMVRTQLSTALAQYG